MNKTNTTVLVAVLLGVAGVAALVAFVNPASDSDAIDAGSPISAGSPPSIPSPVSEASPGSTTVAPDARSTGAGPAELSVLHRMPDFQLLNQSDEALGTDQLFGRAWIVGFFDPTSQTSLTLQAAGLAEVYRTLQEPRLKGSYRSVSQRELASDVRLVSVSTEPDVPPQRLAAMAKEMGADGSQWQLASGTKHQLEQFRRGILASGEADTPSASTIDPHRLILVDPQGHVRGYYDSHSPEQLAALKRDVVVAVQERVLRPFSDIIDPAWLDARRQQQLDSRELFDVFHDFSFTDRVAESGIDFRNRIVDDAGRTWKPAHYDHGNGVAVADVDNDGLYDLYFVTQVGRNELWRNLGDGRFEEITDTAGVALRERIGVSASFADIDNDGDADLYVTNVRGGNVLFENDGSGRFTDISRQAGVDYDGHSSSAVFFDYNRDGLLDLFLVNVGVYTTDQRLEVVNDRFTGPDTAVYEYYSANPDAFAAHVKPARAERSILYENQGGNQFADVSEQVNLVDESWSGDASPLDVNRDGWPDLYVINMQGHDEYYENVEGKKFVKRSRELFPATPWGTMGIKVFDFDNDGRLDIYLTDMHTDMATDLGPMNEKAKIPKEKFEPTLLATDGNHVWGNAFFHNQGDGQFREVSEAVNAENYWPWGLSVGDLNADGYTDVFITACMNFPFRYGVNSLLLNNRGEKFLDSEFIVGVEPRRGGRTAIPWFEFQTAGQEGHPIVRDLRSSGVHLARLVPWGALGSRSSVIFDLDDDGDLDIVTNDFNSEPMVLVSDLTEQKEPVRYLKVKLVGNRSNRDGLGASVEVKAGTNIYRKVHDGQSGYLSQSSYPLYFGLGDAEQVDRIEVVWSSGTSQVVEGPLQINRTLEINEPAE